MTILSTTFERVGSYLGPAAESVQSMRGDNAKE